MCSDLLLNNNNNYSHDIHDGLSLNQRVLDCTRLFLFFQYISSQLIAPRPVVNGSSQSAHFIYLFAPSLIYNLL